MKKVYFINVIIIFLLLTSCSKDFLDRPPFDRKSIGNFYKTPKDALEALVAVYDVLQGGNCLDEEYDHILIISEVASDDCFAGCGAGDDFRFRVWDEFKQVYANPHPLQWQKYYIGIYRANVFLENVDNIEWGKDVSLKTRYTAEARFLRAYFYFDLVRLFGHVPLLTKVADPYHLLIPQAPADSVYKVIAEDLKFTIENLDNKPYSSIPPDEYGRVTKWAAEGLLGRVFLYYTGYYNKTAIEGLVTKTEATAYIDDVINNSGYALVDSFTHLWQYSFDNFAGEDNFETVFAIKYTYKDLKDGSQRDGNRWQVMIGPRLNNYPPYGHGYGAATVNPALWNAFDPDDTRRDGTIIYWDSSWTNNYTITHYKVRVDVNNYIDTTFDPTTHAILSIDTAMIYNSSDQREFTGYAWRKFCPVTDDAGNLITEDLGGNFMRDNYFDFPVIRFADVLLMSAELHLDDNLSLAQVNFDKVRERAFLGNFNSHRITLSDDAAGKKAILDERRFEFALEGQRYWDLLRQDGKAGNFAIAKAAIDCDNPIELAPVVFRPETEGVFEIPTPQIDLSKGTLVQNPGWE